MLLSKYFVLCIVIYVYIIDDKHLSLTSPYFVSVSLPLGGKKLLFCEVYFLTSEIMSALFFYSNKPLLLIDESTLYWCWLDQFEVILSHFGR